ncbi:MAG: ABC transporter substrate-binding protein/permease, partial [Polyangiales bacterium]
MAPVRCTLASLCLALLVHGCARTPVASGLARVKQSGVLRWGADLQGGEPYLFEDPKHPGAITGFEVEIAQALGRELGVRPQLVQNDWSTLVPSLERGTFDVILNGLEVTPARKRRIAFTRPYYVFAEQLVARLGDGRVTNMASVRGLRVGTLASSLAWDMLGPAGAIRVPYEGVAEPFIDLLQKRTDAVLLDDVIVARYGMNPDLRVVSDETLGEYAIGVRQDEPDLRAALDTALGRVIASGELHAILSRWKLDDSRLTAAVRSGGIDSLNAPPSEAGFELSAHQLALFVKGAGVTIVISTAAMALAIGLGMLLALARLPSPLPARRALGRAATVYVEVFRGTPVLLQLYVLYYGLSSVTALGAFTAAILGLGLNYAAYEAEIYRAGIQAVPRGEIEAAHALGMSGALALRRVILPQAVRFSLPGVANDFIALLKDSSLVSVITVVELTKRMTIAAVDGRSWLVPGLLC